MSAEEYGLWMAAYAAEPWGEDRMDIGFGVVASTNVNLHLKPGAQAYTALDFAPVLRARQAADAPAEADDISPAEFIKRLNGG